MELQSVKLNEKTRVYMHENAIHKRTSVNTSKGLRPVRLFHRYLQSTNYLYT